MLHLKRTWSAAALDILKQIPELKCLYLKGNPLVSTMKNYRKTVVNNMPFLTYLDERPVFEEERRLISAWSAYVPTSMRSFLSFVCPFL